MGSYRVRSALVAGMSCALVYATCLPATADIEQEIAQVQSELANLQQQAAAAAEAANDANLEWQQAQEAVTAKQAELEATRTALTDSQRNLDMVVGQIYRNGGVDPTWLVLAADQPSDWLATLDVARIIAGQQNSALVSTEVAEQQLTRDEQALQKAERKAQRARDDMLDAKSAIDSRVAESTALLSQLQVEQQQQLAEELARQQEQQQEQAQDAVDAVSELPASTTRPVVKFAIRQVGKPFEAGATGPDSYDSSGLVKAAWAVADVDLPHSVQRQYDTTERVDITALAPGDIVFLYGTGKHAGIYTGDGYFVHAKGPREGVVYEKLFTNEYMAEFAGAGRPGS
ncbi:MAG: NlpC/P60 family protein [Candidatus Nanopelagicales bacterium]|jgi:cell wall-associated NlpC family hydrolase|nr:NlpC/P60 family protein [Candidatus Nanopelagicales bacterium]